VSGRRWLVIFALFGAVAFVVTVVRQHATEAERRYAAISAGMTIDDVTKMMGRENDGGGKHAAGRTKNGRLWQSWHFTRWGWQTLSVQVEHEDDGRVTETSLSEFRSETPYTVLIERQTFP
jgi:hypothetical protein